MPRRRRLSLDINMTLVCSPSPYNSTEAAAAAFLDCAPPVPSDPSTPIHLPRSAHHLPLPLIILSAALISAALLLSLACLLLLHLRRRRRQLLLHHQEPLFPPPPPPDVVHDGLEPLQHHVWLIRTVGLDEATIKAIVAWPYKASEGLVDSTDCAVCLGEFKDGELLKLLPKCSHAFHVPCIDTWLGSHVNCPLCRAPVVAPKISAPTSSSLEADDGSSSSGSSVSRDTDVDYRIDLIPRISAHPENADIAVVRDLESDHVASDENGADLPVQIEGPSSIVSVLQPVRRSVSLDSFSLDVIVLREELAESARVAKEERKEERSVGECAVKNKGKQGNSSKGPCLQKRVLGMERSFSSSGRRFCLSRHRRVTRSSSILPL